MTAVDLVGDAIKLIENYHNNLENTVVVGSKTLVCNKFMSRINESSLIFINGSSLSNEMKMFLSSLLVIDTKHFEFLFQR